MNIEFHYYAIYHLCVSAGFSPGESTVAAVSSQLVDECMAPWKVVGQGGNFATEVTQNYLFWTESVRRDIYLPFHFLPGDREAASAARKDGKAGAHAVTPDSPLAKEILVAALRTGDFFRIGIALHAYADTWAHQNFSGEMESANAMERDSLLPAAGHLQALSRPDDPALRWRDPRLKPEFAEVDNAGRFLAAARMIYRYLCTFGRRGFSDESFVLDRLEGVWRNPRRGSGAVAHASDYVVDLDVPPYERGAWPRQAGAVAWGPEEGRFPGYDRVAWLAASADLRTGRATAFRGEIPEASWTGSLFEKWNSAARAHRDACRTLFARRGI